MVVFTNEKNTPEANETKTQISEWRKDLNPRMGRVLGMKTMMPRRPAPVGNGDQNGCCEKGDGKQEPNSVSDTRD